MTCKQEVEKVYGTRRCPPCNTAATRKWRQKNKEAVNANQRAYKKANRAIYTAAQAQRRAGLGTATPVWADTDEISLIYKQAKSLEKLLGIDIHVDHVVPLKGETVCGLHVPDNLKITKAVDNMRKGNRYG
jgi:ABC-type nitrate/sulfonate/bicarbonate transport system substrate-binding protein